MRERGLLQSKAALRGHSQESRRTTSQHSTPCFISKSLPYLPSAGWRSLVLISCIVCEDALMRSAKLFIYWTDCSSTPLHACLCTDYSFDVRGLLVELLWQPPTGGTMLYNKQQLDVASSAAAEIQSNVWPTLNRLHFICLWRFFFFLFYHWI